MKILLFGKNGQVGWELNRSLLPLGEVIALDREGADFSDPESLRKIVHKIKPDVVVNAVAYTNVDKAESEKELANWINTVAPGVLAEECQSINALMVHFSTDYVFDGNATDPYLEDSKTNPLNVYGRTKSDGEVAVRNECSRYLMIRSGWVYASRGKNFVRSVIDLIKKRDVLHIVDDQVGAPTSARNIADASVCMIGSAMSTGSVDAESLFGTYHLSSGGSCSWFELAKHIKSYLEKSGVSHPVEIFPISSDEYNSVAHRPGYTVLDNKKVSRVFAVQQVDWEYALELCMDEMRL